MTTLNCATCPVTVNELDTVTGCVCCPLSNDGQHHDYSAKTCPKCGKVFCYSCCGGTNVDQGGKHQPDFMSCPQCGHDICQDDAE